MDSKDTLQQDNSLSLIDKTKAQEPSINYWPYVTTLNASRSEWGQGSVYEKYPDKLNFALFRHVASNTIAFLTLLDLWHPSSATQHMTPPDSLPRSELVSVNIQALEIFSTHRQHIVEMRLCSCVCNFGPDELNCVLANSNKLKRLYLRCYESRYDFLEWLGHEDFEMLHLETHIVDIDELILWLRELVTSKLFTFILRCGVVVDGKKLEHHDFGLPPRKVSKIQGIDVMSECRTWSVPIT